MKHMMRLKTAFILILGMPGFNFQSANAQEFNYYECMLALQYESGTYASKERFCKCIDAVGASKEKIAFCGNLSRRRTNVYSSPRSQPVVPQIMPDMIQPGHVPNMIGEPVN